MLSDEISRASDDDLWQLYSAALDELASRWNDRLIRCTGAAVAALMLPGEGEPKAARYCSGAPDMLVYDEADHLIGVFDMTGRAAGRALGELNRVYAAYGQQTPPIHIDL